MDLFVRRFVAISCRCPVVHSCPFPWSRRLRVAGSFFLAGAAPRAAQLFERQRQRECVMQTKCIDEGVHFGEGLIRPCVDCGRRTGSFCDAGDVVAGVCRLALPWPFARSERVEIERELRGRVDRERVSSEGRPALE